MKRIGFSVVALLIVAVAALLVTGCASTGTRAERRYIEAGEQLPKPGRIIVYDFAVSPSDLHADSEFARSFSARETPLSPNEQRLGRNLAARISERLVQEILALRMPAERAGSGRPAGLNDIIIRGEFVSIDEGSRIKRMVIGFGAGASNLQTVAQAYQVTDEGLRRLGELEIEAKSGKMPGMAVPVGAGAIAGRAAMSAAVSAGTNVSSETIGGESIDAAATRTAKRIAEVLKRGFVKQGWISK